MSGLEVVEERHLLILPDPAYSVTPLVFSGRRALGLDDSGKEKVAMIELAPVGFVPWRGRHRKRPARP